MGKSEGTLAAFRKLIATPELPALGPQERPGALGVRQLEDLLREFFQRLDVPVRIQPPLRSAALLWHDHLDASHTVSQTLETGDGSWLHGIMHRREPDYGNAKYWFRRVGQHEAFPIVAERVAKLRHDDGHGLTGRLIENGAWMPLAFIDECERAESGRDAQSQMTLRQIQAVEFDALIEHILSPDA